MTRLFDRRTVLRGMIGGTVAGFGLPVLEAMLNSNGTALASGAALPVRYGTWFWGVGAYPSSWTPTPTPTPASSRWTPTGTLAALAPLSEYVSLVSGARFTEGGPSHYIGQAYMLSGLYDSSGSDQTTNAFGSPGGPSTDQIVAALWKGQTYLDSVVVGISEAFQGGCLAGAVNTCTPPTQASWIGDSQPNYHEFSLVNFYNRLFSTSTANVHNLLQQRSILDIVSNDMTALMGRLGRGDRTRLDAHAQAIRDMEVRLTSHINACSAPVAVTELPDPYLHEPLTQRNQLFSQMIATALACDLTRVFTVQYTGRENDTIFWQVGANDGTHTLSHEGTTASTDLLNQITSFTMSELAYFLQLLQSTPDGVGNLLDSCSIYITSCVGDPTIHSYDGAMLQMIAGGGGGTLKPGTYYQATSESTSAVALTAMQAAGVSVSSFGSNSMLATAPIAALMT